MKLLKALATLVTVVTVCGAVPVTQNDVDSLRVDFERTAISYGTEMPNEAIEWYDAYYVQMSENAIDGECEVGVFLYIVEDLVNDFIDVVIGWE